MFIELLEFSLAIPFLFLDQSFFGLCVGDLEVKYLSFLCLQFGRTFFEESLEVTFPSGGLFSQFAELCDGFVVTFCCFLGDNNLGLELFFVLT